MRRMPILVMGPVTRPPCRHPPLHPSGPPIPLPTPWTETLAWGLQMVRRPGLPAPVPRRPVCSDKIAAIAPQATCPSVQR